MNINKLKRSIIFFILQFSIIFTQVNNNEKTLRFKKDGTFKILQFTDLHYGELPLEKDLNSSNIQKLILQWEHPDLVVLTGDMVSGYAWNRSKIEPWFIKRFNQLIEPMMELGYRWAYALGNHDDQVY
jgi:predicted MPP superfamily phosphohydrolase